MAETKTIKKPIQSRRIKLCLTCNLFFVPKDERKNRLAKFCSRECIRTSTQFDGSQNGEKHYEWLGDKASYSSKHHWMRKVLGKPKSCLHCGKLNKEARDGRSIIQWANVDHKYSRLPEDYIPLCPRCHKQYDQRL